MSNGDQTTLSAGGPGGLRIKLALGFVGLLAILFAVGSESISLLTRLGGSIDVILRENYKSVIACERMKESLERMDSGALFALAGHAPQGSALARENRPRFEAALATELGNITLPGEGERAHRLRQLFAAYTPTLMRVLDPGVPLEERRALYFQKLFPTFQQIKGAADEGKVYVPDQAAQAVQKFFRPGNLIALRELALRKTAERVDAQMEHYRQLHGIAETWPVAERILVAVSSGPGSARLVRAARGLAALLRAQWLVVYVETPSEAQLPEEEKRRVWETLRLAEKLGAETAVLTGRRPAEEILRYARRRNVSKIVVGKPRHARWKDFVFGSVRDELERGSDEIDVYVISGEESGGFSPPLPVRKPASPLRSYLWSLGIVALCAGVGALLFERVESTNLAMVFLLGVVIAAARLGRGPSILAVVLRRHLRFLFHPSLSDLRRLRHGIPDHLRGDAGHPSWRCSDRRSGRSASSTR
jgi:nucleotide-binding universal stress UspA family protein